VSVWGGHVSGAAAGSGAGSMSAGKRVRPRRTAVAGRIRAGDPRVCPPRTDTGRRSRVAVSRQVRQTVRLERTRVGGCGCEGGWKVPARTGTYGLVPRRRSGTRLPWSQGRLGCCPAGNDTRRRARAAYRFFLSWVLWEKPPTKAEAPRVVNPEKPGMKKRATAGPRRRAALFCRIGHRRPCRHGSLVPLRRRKTSPYVPVRAGPVNPSLIGSPRACPPGTDTGRCR
jgi:hypothetical protein